MITLVNLEFRTQALFYPKNPTLSDWSGDKIREETFSEKPEPCHQVRLPACLWVKDGIKFPSAFTP
jgi:hypothetical protein